MSEWEKIDTVPRNGPPLDLWHKEGFRVTEVFYDTDAECFSNCSSLGDYSHWMKIPAPPNKEMI